MFNLEPPQDDGLCIPEVGEWSKDKHYFLHKYVNAFTTAMKDKWSGLHYIDLFAGAGIEKLKDSQKLDWGSPLIAAQTANPFSALHLCELDEVKYNVLRQRVKKYHSQVQILHGDANEKISEIIYDIPGGSLSLAFLDPFGLHLDFKTLRTLGSKRADLIIFFPDHLDAKRNWEKYYLDNPESNLDRCLGEGTDWRAILNKTPNERQVEKLRDMYVSQLRTIGYEYFEFERIYMNRNRPLYLLIFCSHHRLGAKIWKSISSNKPNGQRTFHFPE